MAARQMREDFRSFAPTHKFFFAGNHKPRISGSNDGIWRRIRLVPWSVQIPAATTRAIPGTAGAVSGSSPNRKKPVET